MPGPGIVVIGGSAGAIVGLQAILKRLPRDFPASIFVVLHTSTEAPGLLPRVLARDSELPAEYARDRAKIVSGRIYIAPPDFHLTVHKRHMQVTRGPRENRHRPAIDPLFRSAARAYGPRVIAVLLSGMLDDGTVGTQIVKAAGGTTIVQDPADTIFPDMPRNAIESDAPNHVVRAAQIPALILRLAEEAGFTREIPERKDREVRIAEFDMAQLENENRGQPAEFVCPECSGTLFEVKSAGETHYRCRVGHSFSPDSLYAANTDALESALWAALRALEEHAHLSRRMADRARKRNETAVVVRRLIERAEGEERQAAILREMLLTPTTPEAEQATGTEP